MAAATRLIVDGKRQWERGTRLIDAHDRPAAVSALEDAAKSYVPGSPYPARALNTLAILAKGAEMRGERDDAIHTWEVVRRSVLATRHIFQPHPDWLTRAEREMERLHRQHTNKSFTARNDLPRPDDPDPWASLLLFAGLLGWGIGAGALCLSPKAAGFTANVWKWSACLGGLTLWLALAYLMG